ncbi:hypothetical protein Q8F57_039600 [Paraburkholderia terrae]|uniref:hypothetical protein n=1 Tax=Paraburkholderia terrae TaxID=311230 RepID=UPI00296A8F3C|nr:hypothetical protein [Paraburkholderia terrae]MDW3658690.1 hypothetical protein [Paraburkholderia terrae]
MGGVVTAMQEESNRKMNAADESSAQRSGTSAFDAAIDFRERLLAKNWPDESKLPGLVKAPHGADAKYALTLMRSDGGLLGVWSRPRARFLYPDFQFDDDGRLIPEMSLLLHMLPAEGDDAGWRRAFWLYSPQALLEGRTPSSIFALDPLKILDVAKAEFCVSTDAGW